MNEITRNSRKKLSLILVVLCLSVSLWADIIPSGDNVACGKKVKITATPKTGYEFVQWSDGNTEPSREVIVTKDLDLTAIFQKITVTMQASDFGENVTFEGGATSLDVQIGDEVKLYAAETECQAFDKWSDGNTDNPRTFVYDPETFAQFTAVYADKLFKVKAEAEGNAGTITIELVDE